jgi:hypothetical protein
VKNIVSASVLSSNFIVDAFFFGLPFSALFWGGVDVVDSHEVNINITQIQVSNRFMFYIGLIPRPEYVS